MFKIFVSIILFWGLFASCLTWNKKVKTEDQTINSEDSIYFSKFPQVTNMGILELTEILKNSKCITGRKIGITGEESMYPAVFFRFCQLASDSLLFSLTKSDYSSLKVCSYKCLQKRNHIQTEEVRSRLINDTNKICIIRSDVETILTVSNAIDYELPF